MSNKLEKIYAKIRKEWADEEWFSELDEETQKIATAEEEIARRPLMPIHETIATIAIAQFKAAEKWQEIEENLGNARFFKQKKIKEKMNFAVKLLLGQITIYPCHEGEK